MFDKQTKNRANLSTSHALQMRQVCKAWNQAVLASPITFEISEYKIENKTNAEEPLNEDYYFTAENEIEVINEKIFTSGEYKLLLLVDDDSTIQKTTSNLAKKIGVDIEVLTSGEDALSLLSGGAEFDFILMDNYMGGISGIDRKSVV